jgi:hypothetical protein
MTILSQSGVWMVVLCAMAVSGANRQAHPPSELLGRWRGTSICTRADWNVACHDEEAYYDAQPGDAAGHVLLHGYKMVNGKPEFMGDLDFTYDPALRAWTSEFQSTRVHSKWIFEIAGDELHGRAVSLPSLRIARDIHVRRQGV